MTVNPMDHTGLVCKIALPYARRWTGRFYVLEDTDEYQDGMVGLLRAVREFKPELGWHFSTFAFYQIRHAVQVGIRDRHCTTQIRGKPNCAPVRFNGHLTAIVMDARARNSRRNVHHAYDDAEEIAWLTRTMCQREKSLFLRHFRDGETLGEIGLEEGISKVRVGQMLQVAKQRVLARAGA